MWIFSFVMNIFIPSRKLPKRRLWTQNIQANGSTGFLVGDSLTWADLLIADHMDVVEGLVPGWASFSNYGPVLIIVILSVTPSKRSMIWFYYEYCTNNCRFFDDFPGMKELKKTVTSMPKLRKWLDQRPQTKYWCLSWKIWCIQSISTPNCTNYM